MKIPPLPERKKKAGRILTLLVKRYPRPTTALRHSNPLQLLVATILSAQCTDVRVNLVTPALFQRYSTAQAFADAEQSELELMIKSTGFFRNKAKSIIACCRALVDRHAGRVPETMDELVLLPGVGRKTANCVLGACFGKNEGVVVDTHVARLAQRLGLTREADPEKIERDLMTAVPQKDWYTFSNALILHGRNVCNARKPACPECALKTICPSAKAFVKEFWS